MVSFPTFLVWRNWSQRHWGTQASSQWCTLAFGRKTRAVGFPVGLSLLFSFPFPILLPTPPPLPSPSLPSSLTSSSETQDQQMVLKTSLSKKKKIAYLLGRCTWLSARTSSQRVIKSSVSECSCLGVPVACYSTLCSQWHMERGLFVIIEN